MPRLDGHCRRLELAPFLAASLLGAALIGAVSSVMDSPRSAFLLFFLVAFAAMLGSLGSERRDG